MYEFQFKQIEIKKDYKEKDFHEFIKELMFSAGVMGKDVSFTMTDGHILKESFLEDINNILNTGEVPNLMLPEDKDYINQELPNQIKIEGSNDLIQQAFVKRVREKFHICLCMSPVGNTLRIRCRQFPSLVNCCTLDWFSKWPAEALLYVSQQKLIEMELPNEDVRDELAKMCMIIHTSVEEASEQFYDELRRRVYTTPKSYLDLISLYINTLDRKRKEVSANKNRLAQGLKKLEETNKQIAELKISLAESAPILAQKDIDLAETMTVVDRETQEANVVKAQVEKEEEVVSKQYSEAQEVKSEVEDDLAAAKPEMDKAKAAVASLEAPAVVEMASFNSPNPNIALVVEPIMLLMGHKKDWKSAQKEMKKTQPFLTALKTFDVATVKEGLIKKVRNDYISKPEFKPEAMAKLSVPAGAMCTWVIALSSYQTVWKKIVPKQQKLAEVSKAAEEAKSILDEKLAGVRAAQDKVDKLNA
jgi:dynein heavy chain